jgi:hypothetical protein
VFDVFVDSVSHFVRQRGPDRRGENELLVGEEFVGNIGQSKRPYVVASSLRLFTAQYLNSESWMS